MHCYRSLRSNVLFVGSDVGAYVSFNTGGSWRFIGQGLPMVSVYDLKVHQQIIFWPVRQVNVRMNLAQVVGINENGISTADNFRLDQNYRNPFNL
ncbi:MAG: hypothetical protein R2942_03290 [Ignavibacteria bacterium]